MNIYKCSNLYNLHKQSAHPRPRRSLAKPPQMVKSDPSALEAAQPIAQEPPMAVAPPATSGKKASPVMEKLDSQRYTLHKLNSDVSDIANAVFSPTTGLQQIKSDIENIQTTLNRILAKVNTPDIC